MAQRPNSEGSLQKETRFWLPSPYRSTSTYSYVRTYMQLDWYTFVFWRHQIVVNVCSELFGSGLHLLHANIHLCANAGKGRGSCCCWCPDMLHQPEDRRCCRRLNNTRKLVNRPLLVSRTDICVYVVLWMDFDTLWMKGCCCCNWVIVSLAAVTSTVTMEIALCGIEIKRGTGWFRPNRRAYRDTRS